MSENALGTGRTGRGLLSKHFPGLFQATASLATANSVNLFGKYLSSAFAFTYGNRDDRPGSLVHDAVDEDKAHVTFVKAVAQSKHPVQVLIISNQVSGPGTSEADFSDEDNSLSSYLEDKTQEKKKKPNPMKVEPVKVKPSSKNIITLKEKNTNLIKLVSSLAQNYSLEIKEIIPFDDIPTTQKTNVILDLIKVNRLKKDPCYIVVVNGDQTAIADVLAVQGLSVTRVGRGMKALNIYETQQIEELRRKLNKTESLPGDENHACASFTLYVF